MDNGQLSGVVFLDIRKAFDSIDHTILLQKMNDQFGIKNVELDWFKSYLTNREQACIVNGAMSSPKAIVCGVPQGSILGPLLFLLYINDLPECLEKTSPHLYADDTQISTSAKTIEELTENLNNDLKKVEPKCQQFCPAIYAPVCGSDGKTYDNMCLLEVADCESDGNITKIHDGPCITNKVCPAFCSLIYDPVCGSNGKTYPNPCSLRFADCEFENDKEITLKHNGSCKSREAGCQQFCPAIYAPVCGSDGKTYDNMCLLEVADCESEENITKVHDGPCKPKCQQFCPAIYAPVCGSDGKTYDNMCLLEVADCHSEENITKVHDGPCITNKVCPAFCSHIYDPVCGSNGKTYPNLCSLRFADCEFENDKEITLKHNGSCKSEEPGCQQFCSAIYAPVCGSDGKTYDNMCLLKVADCESEENITKVHDGPCITSKVCPAFCPNDYDPMCGSNGKTYSNLCSLRFADCEFENDKEITLKHNGSCKSKESDCQQFCPTIYAPVCGSDGKTYDNMCLLEVADCESEENVTKVHDGPCKPSCQKACPLIYAPVCGSDGKTYDNICALEVADCQSEENITKVHDGPCKAKCPIACPKIYAPVCGSDGKTYNNTCLLEVAACESEENITKVHDGPCSE
ncbi:Kazal-type serine ase inhibitor 1 [Paramuricea clavata]|uniref:Kazal-type serine ase inhibitor 1 n=1 Tax=Paramuricea clavata TaxID=317549 RepID=A0A6S7HU30_PARCT|nr:Kazal-type serine ase inhibitor 1 [Paramuricea clavata]